MEGKKGRRGKEEVHLEGKGEQQTQKCHQENAGGRVG